MSDPFPYTATGMSGPAIDAFAITPDDAIDLAQITRALYSGAGGDLAVIMQGGGAVTFKAVPAGVILPLRVKRVMSTGTTALDLRGLV
ncbi:MAG: hypothetical protein COA85_04930 [Robiginitomaculum sp.]|nr:MAG: hypothetical protein COA85_04930 [Robiginitomaculum sp.]